MSSSRTIIPFSVTSGDNYGTAWNNPLKFGLFLSIENTSLCDCLGVGRGLCHNLTSIENTSLCDCLGVGRGLCHNLTLKGSLCHETSASTISTAACRRCYDPSHPARRDETRRSASAHTFWDHSTFCGPILTGPLFNRHHEPGNRQPDSAISQCFPQKGNFRDARSVMELMETEYKGSYVGPE